MPYLLNFIYLLLILLSLPWLVWQSVRKGKYREGFAAKLLGIVPRRDAGGAEGRTKCAGWHAVSVGEVNLLAPLLKRIDEGRPDWQCVISTTTMTGIALAQKKYPRHTTFYCPLDFSWAVKTAMRRLRPDVLVLAELELWPNLIRAARKHGAKVAVINGRLGEKSFRGYRRIRPLVAGLLRQIDLLAVQDESYAERFRQLGAARDDSRHRLDEIRRCTDRPRQPGDPAAGRAGRFLAQRHRALGRQHPGAGRGDGTGDISRAQSQVAPVAISACASSSRPFRSRSKACGLVRHSLAAADGAGQSRDRRSREQDFATLDDATANGATSGRGFMVLLVNVVGELGAWWGTARIAFVGGSMGSRGGQNMIEPAAYGAAVSLGPNTWNFRDIVAAMLAQQAAVVVRSPDEFTRFVGRCLEEPDYAAELGRRAQSLVLSQLGATDRTLTLLTGLL